MEKNPKSQSSEGKKNISENNFFFFFFKHELTFSGGRLATLTKWWSENIPTLEYGPDRWSRIRGKSDMWAHRPHKVKIWVFLGLSQSGLGVLNCSKVSQIQICCHLRYFERIIGLYQPSFALHCPILELRKAKKKRIFDDLGRFWRRCT